MTTTGDVQITLVDGGAGAVVVPSFSVQLVIGPCSGGTAAQIVATRNPQTLQANLGYGLLPEAAALPCLAGGTVLAMKTATTTPGTATAVIRTGGGTSIVTVTLDGTNGAFDDYFVKVNYLVGGTIAATGIIFQISLDAGRTFGPRISLGTANSYVIPNTGITLNFAAGTIIAGSSDTFSTVGPMWNTAGIQACLNAFQASQYGAIGIGSIHIVAPGQTGVTGANASTIQGYLDTLATGYIFNRAMLNARDAIKPVAWGGAGETDSVWQQALITDYASTSAKRILPAAGYYNMPSAFPNPAGGAPRYRRSLAWANAARTVAIPPQRHSGRVRDGSLSQIVVDPINDPNDGFVYHDERINPGLDILTGGAGRFCSARTRVGLPGIYIVNPLLASPIGSDFTIWPLGAVMDVACTISHQVGQKYVNADVRLNQNGTIYENDAKAIEQAITQALNDQMVSKAMISAVKVSVDRSVNVQTTQTVKITISITARGYILEVDIAIGLGNVQAAA